MKEKEQTPQAAHRMDMLHGSIAKNVLLFSLPLAASSILQQLFNSADVAVVGRFAGSNALAAVGSNASMTALFVNIFVGLAVGANVVLANLIGQQKKQELEKVVHTIILFALLGGMFMLVLGQLYFEVWGIPDVPCTVCSCREPSMSA